MRNFFGPILMSAVLCSCSVNDSETKNDVGTLNLSEIMASPYVMNDSEAKAQAAHYKLVDEQYNKNARAYNERIRTMYDRGVKACEGLLKAGYKNRSGCPRPKPEYLELR